MDQKAYTDMLGEMLQQHPNCNIDLSWIVFENYIMDKDGANVRPEWLSLIEQYHRRFMIGSDNIGHFETYSHNVIKYYPLLDALSPEACASVARNTFLTLLPDSNVAQESLEDAA